MNNIRILICDDHAMLRAGIIAYLEKKSGLYVIGEASNGNELIEKYETLKPDLVITDIAMPGLSGTEAVKKLKLKYPAIKVLFISILLGEFDIYYTIKVGGLGLLGKDILTGELFFAINKIYSGKYYFGPNYNDKKIQEIIEKYDNQPSEYDFNSRMQLTDIEDKILEYINDNYSSIEIAEKMEMPKRTIDSQRINIMKKYGLKNTLALIKFAIHYTEFKKNKQ